HWKVAEELIKADDRCFSQLEIIAKEFEEIRKNMTDIHKSLNDAEQVDHVDSKELFVKNAKTHIFVRIRNDESFLFLYNIFEELEKDIKNLQKSRSDAAYHELMNETKNGNKKGGNPKNKNS